MKKLIILTVVTLVSLSTTVAMAHGLHNVYIKVEDDNGTGPLDCGEDEGTPVWSSTAYRGDLSRSHENQGDDTFWTPVGFPRLDIDAVRVKVKCDDCQLYDHGKDLWRWYDTVQNYWRTSIDLGGYHYNSGGDYYYRGEEKKSICNDDYDYDENIMLFYWNTEYPRDEHRWKYKTLQYVV